MNKNTALEFLSKFSNPTNQFFCVLSDEWLQGVPFKSLSDHDDRSVYFMVNESDRSGRRKKENITRIRAVFADDDIVREYPREDWPLEPTLIVNSSPGKFHYYWVIKDGVPAEGNADEWNSIQLGICQDYSTDDNARDICRVLRLPGSYHPDHRPHEVTFGVIGKSHSWKTITSKFKRGSAESSKGNSEIQRNVSESISGSEAEAELKSGKTGRTHRCIISLANSMFFKGHTYEQVVDHINDILPNDENGNRHRKQLAEDVKACEKRVGERITAETSVAATDVEYITNDGIAPKFPSDCFEKWPEPWPMIWENFRKIPFEMRPELLAPTMISSMAYSLKARFCTMRERRPNMFFLNLAPSTGYKDTNSIDVLRKIGSILSGDGPIKHNMFTQMTKFNPAITSDSAFLESFTGSDDDISRSIFWINTEATGVFEQAKSAVNRNAHVTALFTKIIEVVNGYEIKGKQRSGKVVKGIQDPNAQIIFFAQPATIEGYLDSRLADSGLLGRAVMSISSRMELNVNPFVTRADHSFVLDHSLVEFWSSHHFNDPGTMKVLKFVNDPKMIDWYRETVMPNLGDETAKALLERTSISAEQLYTIVLGLTQLYDAHKNWTVMEAFDTEVLIPMVQYWHECKMYLIENNIRLEADPLAEAIIDIVREFVSGHSKVPIGAREAFNATRCVPVRVVRRKLSQRPVLMKKLADRGEARDFTRKLFSIVDGMVRNDVLVEIEHKGGNGKKVKCVGIPAA